MAFVALAEATAIALGHTAARLRAKFEKKTEALERRVATPKA